MHGVALITGSTRGIGFEVARQLAARDYRVIVTGRAERDAASVAAKIGGAAVAHVLDTSDAAFIADLGSWVTREIGRLDVLVNNAAILIDEGESILTTKPETFEATMRVNALGPLLMTQAVTGLLRRSKAARVVNVSSGAGQISSMSCEFFDRSIRTAGPNSPPTGTWMSYDRHNSEKDCDTNRAK